MKSKTLDELIAKIDTLYKIHLSTRGILQYISEKKLGESELNWGSNITSGWIDIRFSFMNPITEETRMELNRMSDYMNQNFIIRLHSLLEYEEIKGEKIKIDKSLKGHKMIEIIHFLRKQFAHKPGDFNPSDSASLTLRNRIFEEFEINPEESLPNQFPLDKNRVIKPIVMGTISYVTEFWKKNRGHEKPLLSKY